VAGAERTLAAEGGGPTEERPKQRRAMAQDGDTADGGAVGRHGESEELGDLGGYRRGCRWVQAGFMP
jgi:hypothetical protein